METCKTKIVSIVLCPIDKMTPEEKILRGSAELFFKYGIRSVTMDDIAKHLGMSKKTIYLYFKEKDEIVHKLMQGDIKQHEIEFERINREADNVVEEVFAIMKRMADIVGKINPLVFYDLQKHYPNTWKLMKNFKMDFVQKMVEHSLEKGIKDGYVRNDVNVKIMARLRMEEVELAFNPDAFSPDKFKIIDVQLALAEHFLYGICTLKGHKLINKYKEVNEDE